MAEILEQSSETDPFDLAAAMSERVQIQNVLLIESFSKRGDDEQFTAGGFSLVHTQKVQEAVRSGDNAIVMKIQLDLISTRDGKPEPDPTLMIHGVFTLVYTLDDFEGIEDRNIAAFASTNGVYNVWPYWREFVQSTTVRMGIPPVVAPVFRLNFPSRNSAQTADSKA